MFKKIIAVMTGLSIIAITSQVIAEPKDNQLDKNKIALIQKVVEAKTIETPSKEEVAKKQIENRKVELAKEAEQKNQQAIARKPLEKTVTTTAKKVFYAATYDVERWRPIVAKYPWPVEQAMLVMKRESGGNPRAVSRTNDHGLFQIHNGLANYGEKIYDPEFNIKLAYEGYYSRRGWNPWTSVPELWR